MVNGMQVRDVSWLAYVHEHHGWAFQATIQSAIRVRISRMRRMIFSPENMQAG